MIFSSQIAYLYPIYLLVLTLLLLVIYGSKSYKIIGYLSVFGAVVVELATVGRTKFLETDWVNYVSVDAGLLDRDVLGGDWLFWNILFAANEILEPTGFHLILKFLSIIVAYTVARQLRFSNSLSLLLAGIWSGTTGFALGTDWYIRQSIANHICVLGWSTFFVVAVESVKTQQRVLWRLYIVPFSILAFSIFIHFGILSLNILIGLIILLFRKTILKILVGQFFDSIRVVLSCLGVTIVVSSLVGFGTQYLNAFVSEEVLKYGSRVPPSSLVGQSVVFLVCFIIYLKIIVDQTRGENSNQNVVLSVVKVGAVYHMVIFLLLAVSMAIGFGYGYILRVNMFKDFYSVISIGFLVNTLGSRFFIANNVSVYLIMIMQAIYLIAVSTATS
jgi:hypothetical protein